MTEKKSARRLKKKSYDITVKPHPLLKAEGTEFLFDTLSIKVSEVY